MVRAIFYAISCRIIQKWHAYRFFEFYGLKQQASEPMGSYPPDFNLLKEFQMFIKSCRECQHRSLLSLKTMAIFANFVTTYEYKSTGLD
jgi:hypothetical protein